MIDTGLGGDAFFGHPAECLSMGLVRFPQRFDVRPGHAFNRRGSICDCIRRAFVLTPVGLDRFSIFIESFDGWLERLKRLYCEASSSQSCSENLRRLLMARLAVRERLVHAFEVLD